MYFLLMYTYINRDITVLDQFFDIECVRGDLGLVVGIPEGTTFGKCVCYLIAFYADVGLDPLDSGASVVK